MIPSKAVLATIQSTILTEDKTYISSIAAMGRTASEVPDGSLAIEMLRNAALTASGEGSADQRAATTTLDEALAATEALVRALDRDTQDEGASDEAFDYCLGGRAVETEHAVIKITASFGRSLTVTLLLGFNCWPVSVLSIPSGEEVGIARSAICSAALRYFSTSRG